MADLIKDGITVGDAVYDLALGIGYVSQIVPTSSLPIRITFTYRNKVVEYNALGELYTGANQTLYFSAPTISPYTPATRTTSLVNIPAGTQIYVSNDNITYIPAIMSAYIAGRADPILAYDASAPLATTALFYTFGRLTP